MMTWVRLSDESVSKCQKEVKLSKRCQFVKKMSKCPKDVKLSKQCQMGGGSQKTSHNEIHP